MARGKIRDQRLAERHDEFVDDILIGFAVSRLTACTFPHDDADAVPKFSGELQIVEVSVDGIGRFMRFFKNDDFPACIDFERGPKRINK